MLIPAAETLSGGLLDAEAAPGLEQANLPCSGQMRAGSAGGEDAPARAGVNPAEPDRTDLAGAQPASGGRNFDRLLQQLPKMDRQTTGLEPEW